MLKKRLAMVMAVGMMAATLVTGCGSDTDAAADKMGVGTSLTGVKMLECLTADIMQDTMEQAKADEKAKAEEQAKKEAEEQAKKEAEEQAKKEAEEKAKAEEQAKAPASTNNASTNTQASTPANNQASTNTQTQSASKPAQPAPAPAASQPKQEQPKPAHQCTWVAHEDVRQEWVPNIVTVDDYAPQQVQVGTAWYCNCGAVVPEELATEHGRAHIEAGESANGRGRAVYETQNVWVGSHQEDRGYYKDVPYVDYYYCSCGATKQP